MAKAKKKPVVKAASKKTSKPLKPIKKVVKKAKLEKAAKPLKTVAKAAAKSKTVAPKVAAKTSKKDDKLQKTKIETKPVPEKGAPKSAIKDLAAKAGKVKGAEKAKKTDKEREAEEFEDEFEEEAISYGDAIRLTPADLEDPEELVLTDAEGRRYCKVKDCDQLSIVEGYCRLHYLSLWKKIQIRKKILTDGKLEKYIEELTSRYPDKYIEMIRRDLKTEKDFLSAIQELEIDDSSEGEFEEDSSFVEEIRGISTNRRGDGESSGGDEF